MISLKRSMNIVDKKYMYNFYAEEFALDNLKFFKAKKLYKLEDSRQMVENFYMNLINDWIRENYEETDSFMFNLKRHIKRTGVELTDVEKDELLILEERIFSKTRHIKILLVNSELHDKENAGAKFKDARLYENNKFITSGYLIITNFRIILEAEIDYSYYFVDVKEFIRSENGLELKMKDKTVRFSIHDSAALINTFDNLYHKKVNKFV